MCQWAIHQSANWRPLWFLGELHSFNDEVNFHLSGHVTKQNMHFWAQTRPHEHRCSQGWGMPPKFLEHIVILCFERRYLKQNSVIRLKSNILAPQIFGLATRLLMRIIIAHLVVEYVTFWWALGRNGIIIEPYRFEDAGARPVTVNTEQYIQLMRRKFIPALGTKRGVDMDTVISQKDGATPHWSSAPLEHLHRYFPGDRLISRCKHLRWPAHFARPTRQGLR